MDERTAYYKKLFRHAPHSGQGDLPKPPMPNAKDLLLEYFAARVTDLGAVKIPIVVVGDYPDVLTTLESVAPDGSTRIHGARGISVVMLDGTVQKFIGNELMQDRDDDGELVHAVGWLCTEEIEVDYWSTNSRDRDFGRDLVMTWLLEYIENCTLLADDLLTMEVNSYYDWQSQKATGGQLPQSNAMHYGVIKLEVKRIFFGTYDNAAPGDIVRIKAIELSVLLDQFKDFNLNDWTGTV